MTWLNFAGYIWRTSRQIYFEFLFVATETQFVTFQTFVQEWAVLEEKRSNMEWMNFIYPWGNWCMRSNRFWFWFNEEKFFSEKFNLYHWKLLLKALFKNPICFFLFLFSITEKKKHLNVIKFTVDRGPGAEPQLSVTEIKLNVSRPSAHCCYKLML